jgi:UDP:flavonoid glycosyltransferase YjiC (YdhE family)
VRILFAFTGGSGHLDPLVPIACAARAADHTVAFTGHADTLATVETLGFKAFPTGRTSAKPLVRRTALQPLDAEREDEVMREGFAGRIARQRAGDVLALCAEWCPDMTVCDEVDFGCMVAAERLGLPYASVVVIAAGSFIRRELVADPLHALRFEHGLPPDPELEMLSRHLVLSPVPPSYRDPGCPPPATTYSFSSRTDEPSSDDAIPPWLAGDSPAVYFTLGTAFNVESGDLFERVITGLRELPVTVVVTVGAQLDPDEFGPQPENVHIERHLSHTVVLPRCSAVVSHGGSGSVLAALAHGLPSVLLPMGADQPSNAARCAQLGVARVLDALTTTPQEVREAAWAVLSEPAYRSAAQRLKAEIDALPGPADAVVQLERLATAGHPSR